MQSLYCLVAHTHPRPHNSHTPTPSHTHTHTPSHTTHTVHKRRVPQFCRFDIEPKLDHHKRQAVRAYDYSIHDDIIWHHMTPTHSLGRGIGGQVLEAGAISCSHWVQKMETPLPQEECQLFTTVIIANNSPLCVEDTPGWPSHDSCGTESDGCVRKCVYVCVICNRYSMSLVFYEIYRHKHEGELPCILHKTRISHAIIICFIPRRLLTDCVTKACMTFITRLYLLHACNGI